MARIVISTIGTKGDLHPYLAIAKELQSRNHRVIIATSPTYERYVKNMGIEFAGIRPNIDYEDKELARISMDLTKGTQHVIKDILFGNLRDTYDDLSKVARGADLLLTHTLCFASSLVAEKLEVPWVSAVLSPNNFWSSYDPSVIPNAPFLIYWKHFGPRVNRLIVRMAKFATREWIEAAYVLREELGLSRNGNPLFEGMHSPHAVLALFSSAFAKRQPDWPPQTIITGFPRYEEPITDEKEEAIRHILDNKRKPVVFTLGTAAVLNPDSFYHYSLEVARELKLRAILLTGYPPENTPVFQNDEDVFCFDYLPYSKVFPFSSAVVHHGGIGTTAHLLHSGVPSVVVPYSHDQPDNAYRLKKLGVSEICYRHKISVSKLKSSLKKVISTPSYHQNADSLYRKLYYENGVVAAADIIEIKAAELK
ncbi:UDP:flavonoid glycosyltransferase YjiC, YdhE family [Hydrobacter penzbergensis]|uniref:UDP:flavonoid glycosyltransferase YjiC, YdhE family n=1 Tax=Hydrobacter penzbergensis TaxID=1235997 RepID=A0A8X8IFS9_9BACT|nr:glycosyltransferase [Hydrobacter penzbergensis]SDX00600.1 UDP:flavonoid glycosyltransferase YjiC, YdhE family [Hydrobacter penzbergensis]